jgi:hypothetical protein
MQMTVDRTDKTVWIESDPPEVCTICGTMASADETEAMVGWCWVSDGRGGLSAVCSSCEPPAALLVESWPSMLAA